MTRITILFMNYFLVMPRVIAWIEDRLLSPNEEEKPYECEKCNTRLALQRSRCPDCGSYQVNWIGWKNEFN